MQTIGLIRVLIERNRKAIGRGGRYVLVGPDGAMAIMRAMMFGIGTRGVVMSSEIDEIALIDGVPVIMRHDAPIDQAVIVTRDQFPDRRCCDVTCIQTMVMALCRGNA